MRTIAVASLVMFVAAVGVAMAEVPAGTGTGRVAEDGSVMLDLKGLGLYKVFIGDANHVQVGNGNFLSFDSGKTNIATFNAGIKQNNVNSTTNENFGAGSAEMAIASALPVLDEDMNIIGWNESAEKDTYVNVNTAAVDAAGLKVWLQTQTTGASTFQIIPEPATMSLLALGALAMLRRRK